MREGFDRPKIRLDMNANRICCHMHLDTSLVRNSKKSACNRTEISNAGGAVPWIERDRVLKMTMAENRHFAKSSGSASKAIPCQRVWTDQNFGQISARKNICRMHFDV